MGRKIFFPGADCLHGHTYADNFISFTYLLTILHSEVTIKAEALYWYVVYDYAVAQSSSAEMNRVLTAQRQTNESHGKDASLLVICFSICSDSQTAFVFYLLVIFSCAHHFSS